jgi:hypothetical protein
MDGESTLKRFKPVTAARSAAVTTSRTQVVQDSILDRFLIDAQSSNRRKSELSRANIVPAVD